MYPQDIVIYAGGLSIPYELLQFVKEFHPV